MKRFCAFLFAASLSLWPLAALAQPSHGPESGHSSKDLPPNKATGVEEHGPHSGAEGGPVHGEPEPELNLADFSKKDEHGNKIPPFVALIANTVILFGIYWYYGKKPIAQALKDRRKEISKEIEEAQKMKREAEERAKHYQAKNAKLEEELAVTKAALLEAGKGEKERIVREAEEKAARMQKDAEFLVEQELKQMRQDLWKETVEAAVVAAEELLKKRITAADQERIAEDYLADLAGPQRRSVAPKAGGPS